MHQSVWARIPSSLGKIIDFALERILGTYFLELLLFDIYFKESIAMGRRGQWAGIFVSGEGLKEGSEYSLTSTVLSFKVHMFWEGHKLLRNLHLTLECMYCSQKKGEDFAKILWPSQNIWTLKCCIGLLLLTSYGTFDLQTVLVIWIWNNNSPKPFVMEELTSCQTKKSVEIAVFLLRQILIVNYYIKNPVKNSQ